MGQAVAMLKTASVIATMIGIRIETATSVTDRQSQTAILIQKHNQSSSPCFWLSLQLYEHAKQYAYVYTRLYDGNVPASTATTTTRERVMVRVSE